MPVDWTKAAPGPTTGNQGPRFFRYGDAPHGASITFTEEPTEPTRSKLGDTCAEALVSFSAAKPDGTMTPAEPRLFSMNARVMADFATHGKSGLPFKGTRWLVRKNERGFWTHVQVLG